MSRSGSSSPAPRSIWESDEGSPNQPRLVRGPLARAVGAHGTALLGARRLAAGDVGAELRSGPADDCSDGCAQRVGGVGFDAPAVAADRAHVRHWVARPDVGARVDSE